ncbi:IclR family transcriptional regulator [Diaminobutyricimonas sp. TR449]|uniref:IclR family transcriptional regulator n=1 Tax=Diaminobutyricimonas sp. TR449 TaxID=2708076 RepID=UPI0014238253|nr:IclR family transcriptional regulator [Diaminobutyricimonas sp. TR449]
MANSPSGDSMVQRIVRVLATFDSSRTTQTPTEIARRAGLPVSSAHRIVGELEASGLLERDEAGTVRIGLHLWELTTRGSRALGLRQLAMPFMTDVQRQIREHTQLAVLDANEVLFIERLSDRGSGANITKVAGRLPIHASSSGLVLLAHADPALQELVLACPLQAASAETITDPRVLRDKLHEVRQLGYAFAPGSIESVSTGIAVPVKDPFGGVIAALSVVLPRGKEEQSTTVRVLQQAATGITQAIRESNFISH